MATVAKLEDGYSYLLNATQLKLTRNAGELQEMSEKFPETEVYLPIEIDEEQSREDCYGNRMKEVHSHVICDWLVKQNKELELKKEDKAVCSYLTVFDGPCILYFD